MGVSRRRTRFAAGGFADRRMVRELITKAAILGLAALTWVGVTYAIQRLRRTENNERTRVLKNPGIQ